MEIFGTSRDDLNGCVAVCESFNYKKGRYVVRLESESESDGDGGGGGGGGGGSKPFMLKPTNVRSTNDAGGQLESAGASLGDDDAGGPSPSQRGGQTKGAASYGEGGSALRTLSTLAALSGAQPALIGVAEMLGVVYKGPELRRLKECFGQLRRGTSNYHFRTRVPVPLTFR